MEKRNCLLGQLDNIEFVVIFTKYQGKWVLCWHKRRESFENPGGHVELANSLGELPESEMGKIELFETVPENFTYDRTEALKDFTMVENMLKAWDL